MAQATAQNQRKIISNQSAIIANQTKILRNQKAIIRNQKKILADHAVKASFFVPAVTALLYPDEQRRVVAEGHEIAIHGWIHERNSILPPAAERMLDFIPSLSMIKAWIRSTATSCAAISKR